MGLAIRRPSKCKINYHHHSYKPNGDLEAPLFQKTSEKMQSQDQCENLCLCFGLSDLCLCFGCLCIFYNSNFGLFDLCLWFGCLNSHLNLALLQTSIEKGGMKEVPHTSDGLMLAVDEFLPGEFLR